MNSKEFVKQVFEIIWQPGASVENHYKYGLDQLPARDNHYTYEATLKKLEMGIKSLNEKPSNHREIMKSFKSEINNMNNMYGYPVDDDK